MAAPTSQKAQDRPIAFALDNGSGGLTKMELTIRPEELTRSEPALMTPVQTFGGAFIDDFGRGLSQLVISGHTGWAVRNGADGVKRWEDFRDLVWVRWHELRSQAVADGKDPDTVKLIFADKLDNIVAVVAPGQLTLRRSRSRPLLMMYQLPMTIITDRLEPELLDKLETFGAGATPPPKVVIAGLESLKATIGELKAKAADVRAWVQTNVAVPVQAFMNLTTDVLDQVAEQVDEVRGIVDDQAGQLIDIAGDLSEAGRNIFLTYNAVAGAPDHLMIQVSEVASAYENAMCLMRNAFRRRSLYDDYEGVYGASICSSTIGGSPLSAYRDTNTFAATISNNASPVLVSGEAKADIDILKAVDPVLAPMSLTDLGARALSIGTGVRLV